MALTGLAVAAALALAKDELIDQPAANRKRKLAAATAAYSPWTGMKPQDVNDPNVIGDMMIAGAGGAAMGASINRANSESNLNNAAAGSINNYDAASGANTLGGQDMAAKLQAKSPMQMGMPPTAADSDPMDMSAAKVEGAKAPFFGNNDGPGAQPSWSNLGDNKSNRYKTLLDAGYDPNNPESYWQINPFKPQNYGGR